MSKEIDDNMRKKWLSMNERKLLAELRIND